MPERVSGVDIMDALYLTCSKFKNNGKIVELSFNVINLLGYLYPDWKSKVGLNFVPMGLILCKKEIFPEGNFTLVCRPSSG